MVRLIGLVPAMAMALPCMPGAVPAEYGWPDGVMRAAAMERARSA